MSEGDTHPTVAVDPPVHVETFATHHTVTWQARGLSAFLDALDRLDAVAEDADLLVDATDVGGRRRLSPSAVPVDDAVEYVRVESVPAWTLSWERRTTPTVSLSGEPTPATCRAVHVATTDCDGWSERHRRTLTRRLSGESSGR